MKGTDAQFMGGGGEIISNADDTEKKLRNISDEDIDAIHNTLQESVYNLPEKELHEFFEKCFFEEFGESMSKEMFCKILDVFIKYNYINPLESGDAGNLFIPEESLLWERIDDYKQFVISKLDFEKEKNFTQTYAYLTFIDALNTYSELSLYQMSNWPETSKLFYDKIDECINNRNSGYFLHLYAKDIQNKHRTQSLDFFEQLNEESDEFEEKMKNKYGNQWERHVDDEFEKEGRQDIIVDNIQKPFLIAPRIYAITDDQGFVISKQEDYQKITTLIRELDSLPNTIDNFLWISEKENFGISPFPDDEIEEIIIEQIVDKEAEILDCFNDELKDDDVLLKNRESGSRFERSDFNDYVALQSPVIRQIIQNGLYINFADLSFNEQFYFLQFAKNTRVSQVDKLREFIGNASNENHKLNRIQSFLSMEQGGQEMGEKIMSIGEKLDQQSADMIFAKYAQLVDAASDVEQYILKQVEDEAGIEANEITEKLLVRGKKLLEFVADNVEMSEESLQKIIEKIEAMSVDVELFKATAKNVREKGGPLEQLKDLQTMTLDGKGVSGDKQTINKMKEMYGVNYEKYPKLQALLVDSIDKKLADPDVQFHFSMYKDEKTGKQVITFLTTKQQDDDSIYFGSFNTDNEVFGGASLGLALAEEVFAQKEQKGVKKIEAHSVPQEGINNIYINRYHFVADGLVENYEDTDVDLFHITREEKNKEYHYQNEISSEELKKDIIDSIEHIDEGVNRFILKFKSGEEIAQLSKQIFEKGFVLTKYDIDKETGNIYCGFEKKGSTI
ncbi:MAG: hypothetical protein U9Q12_01935 [Patescibacteria group bacterium]|nr:hypothetical protein [Patescibacteria group bacterium]